MLIESNFCSTFVSDVMFPLHPCCIFDSFFGRWIVAPQANVRKLGQIGVSGPCVLSAHSGPCVLSAHCRGCQHNQPPSVLAENQVFC